ncbi:MAG: DUF4097 family beta strand repeat-containing protein [Candidatus Eiseniibacteriota bacterium]
MCVVFAVATAAVFTLSSGADTTIAVSPGLDLQVANFSGSVDIRSWDKNAVRIQADSPGNDKIIVKRDDDALLIKGYSQRNVNHTIDLTITAPAWMNLIVSGVNTDVSIDGTKGRVRVDTVHGDIAVVGGRGQIELNAINQDIHLTDASGTVLSETVNGDLTLQRIVSDSVEVSTVNGEIFYEGTIRDRGVYRFTSHNGDVAVALPKAANATVSVSTFSGEFESDFPVTLKEVRPGRRFCFITGRGSAQIELESFQGTIHIFRPGTRGPVAEMESGDDDSDRHTHEKYKVEEKQQYKYEYKNKKKSSDDNDSDSDENQDEDQDSK